MRRMRREVSTVVKKETCPSCRGDKVVRVTTSDGTHKVRKCPECGGNGYKVRMVHHM